MQGLKPILIEPGQQSLVTSFGFTSWLLFL